MTPFALPATLEPRQYRAARAWRQVHLARLKMIQNHPDLRAVDPEHLEAIGERLERIRQLQALIAVCGAILLGPSTCPNCRRPTGQASWPPLLRIAAGGVIVGTACGSCSSDLRDLRDQ